MNLKAAFDCYAIAASLGHSKAHLKIGNCYYSGVKEPTVSSTNIMSLNTTVDSAEDEPNYVIKPNQKLALKHYIKAADLGEDEACNSVALIIEKENPIDAVLWYKKAL
jgi:TPR repeat protein